AGGLWAIAEHHRLTGDGALLGELIPAVQEGVRILSGHHVVASLPFEHGFWMVRALVDGAWLLRLAGDAPAAEEAEAAAAQLGDAFYDGIAHTGLAPSLTLRIARCELEAGDVKAWRRLRWMLDAATSTFTWPEAIHPGLGSGCVGDGHHGGAAAGFLGFVRQVF